MAIYENGDEKFFYYGDFEGEVYISINDKKIQSFFFDTSFIYYSIIMDKFHIDNTYNENYDISDKNLLYSILSPNKELSLEVKWLYPLNFKDA